MSWITREGVNELNTAALHLGQVLGWEFWKLRMSLASAAVMVRLISLERSSV